MCIFTIFLRGNDCSALPLACLATRREIIVRITRVLRNVWRWTLVLEKVFGD